MLPPLDFTSPTFLFIFVPATLAAYYALRNSRLQNAVLAVASLAFYATTGVIYLLPLLFTCVLDYVVGAKLAQGGGAWRRWLFVGSLTVQIGLLATFKYLGWLSVEASHLAAALGIGMMITPLAVPLPPGISFYTFHTISYTADIYRRRFRPQGNLLDYITFVAFFPQLVAGPIARASDLLPQLVAKRPMPTRTEVEEALWLIAWGLAKKLVLADRFGMAVAQAERALAEGNAGGAGYVFMYGFALQIYCDFSAYTDIARGLARLFGVQLTRNFLTPYFASSPSDFWRRWHISLSTWMRDYLYIPLGGSAGGHARTLRNLLITMLLGGLWHGAGVGFLIWGAYHAILLIVHHLTRFDERLRGAFGRVAGGGLAIFVTFHLVCIGWIFFRGNSETFGPIFASMAATPLDVWANPLLSAAMTTVLVFGLPVLITEIIGYVFGCEFVDLFRRCPFAVRAALFVTAVQAALFLPSRTPAQFIYFQF